jgi:serine/threonine-protein kinase
MATVWVARRKGDTSEQERLIAVKVMLADLADEPEFRKMFHDEVNLVSRIRHPNVVDVYGVGEHQNVLYMLMEWVEGDSLHTLIAEAGRRRPIPPEIAVRIIAEAAAGLHAAHELRDAAGDLEGVVHRDISPHNVLISTSGDVKLVDFGVAKAMGRLSEATRVGQLKGKFGYMSPEQATGRPVDRRSDVFSLGIVLFELTTNRRLFRGETDVETLKLVLSGQIPKPTRIDPSYPPRLESIVLKALRRDVNKRYQTAAALERELNDYLSAERIVVPRSGVAGLLKRVTGARIEQRRKAVRSALKALRGRARAASQQELLPNDSAFTPTGRDRITVTGASSVTGSQVSQISALSQLSQASLPSVPNASRSPPFSSSLEIARSGPSSSWIGYVIGVIGFGVAAVVLLLYGQRAERVPLPGSAPPLVPARAAPSLPASKAPESAPSATSDPGVPTVGVEELGRDARAKRR